MRCSICGCCCKHSTYTALIALHLGLMKGGVVWLCDQDAPATSKQLMLGCCNYKNTIMSSILLIYYIMGLQDINENAVMIVV